MRNAFSKIVLFYFKLVFELAPDRTVRKQRVDATRLNGLGVWFSLWVREVPGSNPGWAQFYFFYGETDIVSHDIYSNICSILTANLIFCQSYNKNFLKKFWATKLQLSAIRLPIPFHVGWYHIDECSQWRCRYWNTKI